MTDVALIRSGVVVNVVVTDEQTPEMWLDDTVEQQGLDSHVDLTDLDPAPGMGWRYDGKNFTAPVPEPPPPTLTVDPQAIPPDNHTPSIVTYSGDVTGTVDFVVNGTTTTKPMVKGTASVRVTSRTPGDVIAVSCEGLSTTISVYGLVDVQ